MMEEDTYAVRPLKESPIYCWAKGKASYDKKTAQTKKNLLEREGRSRNLRIYQCPACNFYHLTHEEKYDEQPY